MSGELRVGASLRKQGTDRTQANISSPLLARLASFSNCVRTPLYLPRLPMGKVADVIGRSRRRKARLQDARADTSFAIILTSISTSERIVTVR